MAGSSNRKQATSLLFLGIFIIILMFFVSWSFRTDNVIAGSFRLEDIQICEELDDNMNPLHIGRQMPGGIKQICLWFTYSRAREGDFLEITWRREERSIQKETFKISQRRDTRAFYLLKEDGTPLPSGAYTVTLLCNGREKATEQFAIAEISGDILLDQDDDDFLE